MIFTAHANGTSFSFLWFFFRWFFLCSSDLLGLFSKWFFSLCFYSYSLGKVIRRDALCLPFWWLISTDTEMLFFVAQVITFTHHMFDIISLICLWDLKPGAFKEHSLGSLFVAVVNLEAKEKQLKKENRGGVRKKDKEIQGWSEMGYNLVWKPVGYVSWAD